MTDQIKSRISNYLKRLNAQYPNYGPGIYVRIINNALDYAIISNRKKAGSETIENILNINMVEALALSAMGRSKEQAKQEVERWLRRGLTDVATEQNTTPEAIALFIHGAPEEPVYTMYLNGKPNKTIDLIETIKKYQNG